MIVSYTMNPRERDQNQEQFLNHVALLTRHALVGNPKSRRHAQRELRETLRDDPYYDPTLIAYDTGLDILTQQRTPKTIREVAESFAQITADTSADLQEGGGKLLRITPHTTRAARNIFSHYEKLAKNKHANDLFERIVPKNYRSIRTIAEFVFNAEASGSASVGIIPTAPLTSDEQRAEKDRQMEQFNLWWEQANQLMDRLFASTDLRIRDAFIDTLKAEPKLDLYLPRGPFYESRYGGISVKDMEQMPYPPTQEDLSRITDYVVDITSHYPPRHRLLAEPLFFEPIMFSNEGKIIASKHRHLNAVIAAWQEQFVYDLIFAQDSRTQEKIRKVLGSLDTSSMGRLLLLTMLFSAYPHDHDPEFRGDVAEREHSYRLQQQAIAVYLEKHPNTPFMYRDEAGMQYFSNALVPRIIQQAEAAGKGNEIREALRILGEEFGNEAFPILHLRVMKDVFERNCGKEFLQRLNEHADEIDQVRKTAWEQTVAPGIHYLPMQAGINIIEFGQNSVPDIIGIESIKVQTAGTPQDWTLTVIFTPRDSLVTLAGTLDKEGKLQLKAPLEKEIPGLYVVLNHIAVLAFHDLAVQDKKEREEKQKETDKKSVKEHAGKPDDASFSQHTESLPRSEFPERVQKDTDLIADVYEKTGYTPRRVEVHPTKLPYAREYIRAVGCYHKSLADNDSMEIIAARAKEVERARERKYRISEEKITSIPNRFQLETITDPLTGKIVYVQTWVAEHTSPTPTAEELRSPAKLFERYYMHSSALASLDQMKPWLVGL